MEVDNDEGEDEGPSTSKKMCFEGQNNIGGQKEQEQERRFKLINMKNRKEPSLPFIYPKIDVNVGGSGSSGSVGSKSKSNSNHKRSKVVKYERKRKKGGDGDGDMCSLKDLRCSFSTFAKERCRQLDPNPQVGNQDEQKIDQKTKLKLQSLNDFARATQSTRVVSKNESLEMLSKFLGKSPCSSPKKIIGTTKIGGMVINKLVSAKSLSSSTTLLEAEGEVEEDAETEMPIPTEEPQEISTHVFKKVSSSEYIYKIPQNHLVNHTIELLRHKRELETRIELIEEEGILHKMDELPKLVEPVPKGQLCIPNIPMTGRDTKNIIQNQLTFSLAHAGFTHVNQTPLEVLADVMEDFYAKMAHRLKQVREMEMEGVEQEFPDPVERVMVEMNMGGVRGLQKYYTSKIVDHRKRVEEQCIYLRKLYAHKIKLKVGMVTGSSGNNSSSSSTTSTNQSSHTIISPVNSVLTEILSGLEGPTETSYAFEPQNEEKVKQSQQFSLNTPNHPQNPNQNQNLHENQNQSLNQNLNNVNNLHPNPSLNLSLNQNNLPVSAQENQLNLNQVSQQQQKQQQQLLQQNQSSTSTQPPPPQHIPRSSQQSPSSSSSLSKMGSSHSNQSTSLGLPIFQLQQQQKQQQQHQQQSLSTSKSINPCQSSTQRSDLQQQQQQQNQLQSPLRSSPSDPQLVSNKIGQGHSSPSPNKSSNSSNSNYNSGNKPIHNSNSNLHSSATLNQTLSSSLNQTPLSLNHHHHQQQQSVNTQSTTFPNNPNPSSMVSINLNNNVDLGGFVPITSPGVSSRTPTLNVNKGIITCGSGDSKAKLKEALSQRNLLRLNFEQVPSSCDSTVLLSSSPSLSSSNNNSPANKTNNNTTSSSLSQTTRLKL